MPNEPHSGPIFIIAAPRSGTTWLVQALNAHPEVFATELRAFGEYVDLVQDGGAAKARLRITLDEYVDSLLNPHQWMQLGPSRMAVRDDILGELYITLRRHALERSGKRVFVDKLTPYLGTAERAVELIARLFPDARVIVLTRDGRDVAVSGVMHWLNRTIVGHALTDVQRTRRAFLLANAAERPERFFTDGEIEEWAIHWRQPIDAMKTRGAALDAMDVRYENMSRDAACELARICEFLGVDAGSHVVHRCVAASTFEVMSGGRRRGEDAPGQHVRKGVVGDWRRFFTVADASVFDRLSGPCLIECGYEPDRGWTTRVPERLL